MLNNSFHKVLTCIQCWYRLNSISSQPWIGKLIADQVFEKAVHNFLQICTITLWKLYTEPYLQLPSVLSLVSGYNQVKGCMQDLLPRVTWESTLK